MREMTHLVTPHVPDKHVTESASDEFGPLVTIQRRSGVARAGGGGAGPVRSPDAGTRSHG